MATVFDCTNINLRYGSKGALVTTLQTHLKNLGYYTYSSDGKYLKIDGDFGTYTEQAVKQFQKATGHTADGVFGPKTCPSLNQKISGTTSTSSTSTTSPSNISNKTTTTPIIDQYAVDTSKNIITSAESNLSIDGLFFSASTIEPDTPFKNGNHKQLELMDGTYKTYEGHPQPLAWTIELSLPFDDFIHLKNEFYKMQSRACNVLSKYMDSGKYTITVDYKSATGFWKKITLKLTEYNGG